MRRPLDLLPLVDVMMVVLFALVVAQERDLGVAEAKASAARGAQQVLSRDLARAERALATTRASDVARLEQQVAQAEMSADTQSATLDDLRNKLREMTKRTVELQQQQWPSPRDFRRDDVLDKLLDQNAVVEVEITGRPGARGIVNRCCFRAGPRAEVWEACGAVPALAEARDRWLDEGADGLQAQLQDTRGGRAVTIIRQDLAATYSVGAELAQTIRVRFPDHKIYNDGVQALPIRCQPKEAR